MTAKQPLTINLTCQWTLLSKCKIPASAQIRPGP